MKYTKEPLECYVRDAAAGEPTPGGGSVSALVGALATGMSEMAANFTTGRRKFADVQDRIGACLQELEPAREKLLRLMQEDVDAYAAVGGAYAMPRGTDAEKALRDAAIQNALRKAMEAPLEVMRQCEVVARAAVELAEIANPNLITDVGVSAILAEAACAAAGLNVEVNLKYMKDETRVEATRPDVERLISETRRCRDKVANAVAQALR